MPFNIVRNGAIVEKEILRSVSGHEDVLSKVVDATTVTENPASSGRYILEAGTVLVEAAGNKVKPASTDISGNSEVVVGILSVTREFYIGDGVAAAAASNEPVSVFHMGCHFDITKLVRYSDGTNATQVKAALPLCKFT